MSNNRYPIYIDDKGGYIDREGKIVIPPQYDLVGRFHEGLAIVKEERVGREPLGLIINSQGEVVVRHTRIPDRDLPSRLAGRGGDITYGDFSEGLAEMRICGSAEGVGGYINRVGEIVIPFSYEHTRKFSEGLALVFVEEQGQAVPRFIGRDGTIAIVTTYIQYPNSFSEGLAGFEASNGKHGYIGRDGEVRIPPNHDRIGDFSCGVAWLVTEMSINLSTQMVHRTSKTTSTLRTTFMRGWLMSFEAASRSSSTWLEQS